MSKELSVGIVGCGGIAAEHVSRYQKSGVQVASVYDVSKESAKKFAGETGARIAVSPEEMAERDGLDAVSICSPPSTHLDNCAPFVAAGIPILCEKPLEVNFSRAAMLAKMIRGGSGVIFMIAFCHRFHPAVIELKKLLAQGVLGKPLLFRNIFGSNMPLSRNHRANPALSGGGCLIDHCSHSIDLFRFLVGEPTCAQALAGNIVQKIPIEDFGMISLSKDGRTFGEITASYSLNVFNNGLELYGTKGTAIISYGNPRYPDLSYWVEGSEEWIPVDCSNHPDRFTGEIRYFLDCVRNGKKPSVGIEDGLQANRIVQAVYKSVAQRKQIVIAAA